MQRLDNAGGAAAARGRRAAGSRFQHEIRWRGTGSSLGQRVRVVVEGLGGADLAGRVADVVRRPLVVSFPSEVRRVSIVYISQPFSSVAGARTLKFNTHGIAAMRSSARGCQ